MQKLIYFRVYIYITDAIVIAISYCKEVITKHGWLSYLYCKINMVKLKRSFLAYNRYI